MPVTADHSMPIDALPVEDWQGKIYSLHNQFKSLLERPTTLAAMTQILVFQTFFNKN